jgi:hypothetical protein
MGIELAFLGIGCIGVMRCLYISEQQNKENLKKKDENNT